MDRENGGKMVEFGQLKLAVKKIVFEMIRVDADNYFEAVLAKEHLSELASELEKNFGVAVWPSKEKLSPRIQENIQEFGGVRDDQTLYFSEEAGVCLLAMLWPWQDNRRITLKMAKK
ncbi:MAG: hypothetical protein M0R66_02855 [Candidatus Omnitrophica bacterium]|nr:hypothetical protein [Candidatus Omnitrophota bacterium]